MLARTVAAESSGTFFSVSASTLMSRWVGDGEKLVKAMFSVAKEVQVCVIYICPKILNFIYYFFFYDGM